jgi:hypothetical protein
MSILNVNTIQPVGSGQTITVSAADISAPSTVITASSFNGNVTATTISGVSTAGITTVYLSPTVSINASNYAGPAFSAYRNSPLTISATTSTKIALNSELFDTDSCFDSTTNYRFTPNVAGYYQINGGVMVATTTTTEYIQTMIYKNGSEVCRGSSVITGQSGAYPESTAATLLYLNGTTDYVELYAYSNTSLSLNVGPQYIYFNGFLGRIV